MIETKKDSVMTIAEYKAQPFKDATIGDYWYTFSRKMRRLLERIVRQGGNPSPEDYFME